MNVVIYARYSSHNQTECSIEGQLEACREYAKRHDYNIVGEYIDRATSGTTDNRPEFQRMIKDSEKKLFNGILVYQLDRFARDRYDSAIYKNRLKKNNNIKVLSARENISDDASGILMESVLEGMAEYFSVELGQKVKRGMGINAENCFYNGGTVPLGLKLETVSGEIFINGIKPIVKKKYVIDEERAPIVRKIFDMYINRNSMAEIIRYLNSINVKTAYRKEFNKNSIRTILLNRKYIGIYSYNGKETIDGIPRIIDDEVFNRAQEELIKNGLAPARSRAKTEYLLTTKLFCGNCKDKMTGKSGTSKTGKLHTYYTCKSVSNDLCDMKSIQKNYIEDIVVNASQDFLSKDNIDYVSNKLVELSKDEQDDTQIKILSKSLKDDVRKRENILNAIIECDKESTRKIMYQELEKIDARKKELDRILLIEKSKHIDISASEIKYFLKKMQKGNTKDFKYRKMLINTLVNRVYLYSDKVIIIFKVDNNEQEIEISLLNDLEYSPMDMTALPIFR
jgi:DNA invertase Pin-like site-specific DNA recombinase